MSIKILTLATPRGFCAGVERAIEILDLALKKYGAPVYVRNHIVHNTAVVADFEAKGAIFVRTIEDIPDGANAILSAHGSSPRLKPALDARKINVLDAVCPLVTKVHREAKKYAEDGYFIFYIGHQGHPEPEGVMGNVEEDQISLVETKEQAKTIVPPQAEKLIILTQTTLSFDDTAEVVATLRERFPALLMPPTFDICYATQNRQNAVKELLKEGIDILIVVGSKHSSNSNRLREVGGRAGIPAYLIDAVRELHFPWLEGKKHLGLTSGASVPDRLLLEVVNKLKERYPDIEVREAAGKEETAFFPLPKELM